MSALPALPWPYDRVGGRSTHALAPGLVLGVGVLAAAIVAVLWPAATSIWGLMLLGGPHIALELRYVIGRFGRSLTSDWWSAVSALVLLVVAARVAFSLVGQWGRTAEVVLGGVLVAVGVLAAVQGRAAAACLAATTLGTGLAVTHQAWYVFLLTHAHNLVPAVLLWDWSRRLRPVARRAFVTAQLGWLLVIPAMLLSGALDELMSVAPTAGLDADAVARVLASAAPPDAPGAQTARWATVFAFQQSVHYLVWIVFLPLFAPDVAPAVERRFPWLQPSRQIALAALVMGGIWAAFLAAGYWPGRTVYGSIAALHVYVEAPVLIVLVAGVLRSRRR